MTNRGALLRGGLIVAIAALGFFVPAAREAHIIDGRAAVWLGTLIAALTALRAYIDTSWGDRPQQGEDHG
jgi:hypothetical protein